ncbi:Clavaminate synthase-like protein [Xylariaceae sp. FL1651]|nr:Clavaminate synthase-like protein [Xylariaceae sp. FL1651]
MLLAEDITHGGGMNGTVMDGNELIDNDDRTIVDSIPTHPMGIKPLGNQYFASAPNARRCSGVVGRLPDEMILHLFEYFDAESLKKLASTCRFFYAFGQLDDLWKTLLLESQITPRKASFWKGSWKATYLDMPLDAQARIDCSNVFSDVLHRPFACAHVALEKYSSTIPVANKISRLENLTYDEFARAWSDTPFILTDCIQAWPVCHEWSIQELHRQYSNVKFRAEAVDWPFSIYHEYMSNSNDESPLYLFDRDFAEKMNIEVGTSKGGSFYWPPECFGPDLFAVLGEERPAHRWLIVGPARSGSTFHKDPNATSAWNAVIQGSKYWIMFPPSTQVPGVFVSEDSSEVTSPLSIAEWLLEFHAEARKVPSCIEGICKAGEILHVPSGWWHLVINLEAGIALTQNFVPKSHLTDVLSFLKNKPDQVTGFKRTTNSPLELFLERLGGTYPQLLNEALEELSRRDQSKKRKWEDAVATKNDDEHGGIAFSFGFADDDDDEIP